MLFLLGLWHDFESILPDIHESESRGNPDLEQVDNFPTADGKIDQPVYEGPQTQSHTKKLMKANLLLDNLFDLESSEICDNTVAVMEFNKEPVESMRDLILQFWYQQLYTVYLVCCDLAEARTHSINC